MPKFLGGLSPPSVFFFLCSVWWGGVAIRQNTSEGTFLKSSEKGGGGYIFKILVQFFFLRGAYIFIFRVFHNTDFRLLVYSYL